MKHVNPICYVVDEKGKSIPVYPSVEVEEEMVPVAWQEVALWCFAWIVAVSFLALALVRAASITGVIK